MTVDFCEVVGTAGCVSRLRRHSGWNKLTYHALAASQPSKAPLISVVTTVLIQVSDVISLYQCALVEHPEFRTVAVLHSPLCPGGP